MKGFKTINHIEKKISNGNLNKEIIKNNKFDVVIPFHIKDKPVIKYSISGCVKNLDIRNIYILTNIKNKAFFNNQYENVKVIDENSFFSDINIYNIKKLWIQKKAERPSVSSRWIYQQLIKMACSYKLKDLSKYYLLLDSDTIFLKKTPMIEDEKILICIGDEYHKPYFDVFKKLTSIKANREYSFIVHHQIINKNLMVELLKKYISKDSEDWQKIWYKNILDNLDYSIHSNFSEYETYGHFLKNYYPHMYKIRNLKWDNFSGYPNNKKIKRFSKKYDFVSFHSHQKKVTVRSYIQDKLKEY